MRYDDPNVPTSVVVGIIGVVATFVLVVILQGLFFSMKQAEMQRKVYSQSNEQMRALDATQLETLNSYGWVNQKAGIVHIPIAAAMQKIAEEGAQAPAQ